MSNQDGGRRPPGAPDPQGWPQQPQQPPAQGWPQQPQQPPAQGWPQPQQPQQPPAQGWPQPPQQPPAQGWPQQPQQPQQPPAQGWPQQPQPPVQGWPPPQQQQPPPAPGWPPPHQQAPAPGWPPAGAPRRTHLVATVQAPTGHGLVAMALLSLKRAFRLRIEPNEVLDDERAALLAARPAIADATQQAFMAWRRSVLFMAALLMIPVAILHAVENLDFDDGMPGSWKTLAVIQVLIEGGFALFLWTQVPRWTRWRQQSRTLAIAWLFYFLAPFAVFLYPLAADVDVGALAGGELGGEATSAIKMTLGIAIGGQALMSLAPKIISLLQGLIRAAIATKTLFPGASGPGWLMVLAAPLYMIIFYVFVLLPYQFTTSGMVVLGMLLVLAAKGSLIKAGLGLTRPMRGDAAKAATAKALGLWMVLLVAGVGCIAIGLWDLLKEMSALGLINFGLSIGANILLITLITTDLLITGLDRASGTTAEERALAESVHAEVAAFTAGGSQ